MVDVGTEGDVSERGRRARRRIGGGRRGRRGSNEGRKCEQVEEGGVQEIFHQAAF